MDLKRYEMEIDNIDEKLIQLIEGNYHERVKKPGIPAAKTIAFNLRKDLLELLEKITNEEEGTQEKIDKAMKNFTFYK